MIFIKIKKNEYFNLVKEIEFKLDKAINFTKKRRNYKEKRKIHLLYFLFNEITSNSEIDEYGYVFLENSELDLEKVINTLKTL